MENCKQYKTVAATSISSLQRQSIQISTHLTHLHFLSITDHHNAKKHQRNSYRNQYFPHTSYRRHERKHNKNNNPFSYFSFINLLFIF